jgi:hypothetical protein
VSTAVDSGLGKRQCLLTSDDLEQIQIKVFISTLLFVLALSISKCSILLFLHQAARNAFQRLAIIVIGVLILLWTLAVMAIIILECEMPTPWQIWTSKCIPLVSTQPVEIDRANSDNPAATFLDHSNCSGCCH